MLEKAAGGDFPLCYGCGRENPVGFKLQVKKEEEGKAWAEFVPGQYHTGWPNIVHGGVLCVLLDEVVSYLPYFYFHNQKAVTGKMEIRFRCLAHPGEPLLISAEILKRRRKVVEARAVITRRDGATVAESECLIFLLEEK